MSEINSIERLESLKRFLEDIDAPVSAKALGDVISRTSELQAESDRVWAYLQSLEDMAADHPQDYYANHYAKGLRAALEGPP